MKYDFPVLHTIEPVLEAIKGREEFGNWVRETGDKSHAVIDYNVNFRDTFPLMVGTEEERALAALRRECRGIAYHPDTGVILSRPFHKFFNAGERPDTLVEDIDLSVPHHALDKLDGSMIRSIKTDAGVLWGTRAGVTNVSEQAREFIESNSKIDYRKFANEISEAGFTITFEWCSRKNRIVLDYPEDKLILTSVRQNVTGAYLGYEGMAELAESYGIPWVESFGAKSNMRVFLDEVRDMQGIEGFVVVFEDGHRVKLKCSQYVTIHRSKDEMRFEKDVVRLILENRVDDLLPYLVDSDREHLLTYADAMNQNIVEFSDAVMAEFRDLAEKYPVRKDFAMAIAKNPNKTWLFHAVAGRDVRECVIKEIMQNTSSGPNLETVRYLIGTTWA